jgi:DNA-binding transcriptional ArsR family regulator
MGAKAEIFGAKNDLKNRRLHIYWTDDMVEVRPGIFRSREDIKVVTVNEEAVDVYDGNVTVNEGDVTVNSENVTINEENVTINDEDVTINGKNVTINNNDVTINEENVTINDEDVTINEDNVTIKKLLDSIVDDPSITVDDLAEKIGKNRRTVLRHLKDLQEQGAVRRTGSRKTGHWEVISMEDSGNSPITFRETRGVEALRI